MTVVVSASRYGISAFKNKNTLSGADPGYRKLPEAFPTYTVAAYSGISEIVIL